VVLGLTDGWRWMMQDNTMEELILSAYSIKKLQSINHTSIHQLQHYYCFQWHMDYFLPVLPLLHTSLTLLASITFSANQWLPTQFPVCLCTYVPLEFFLDCLTLEDGTNSSLKTAVTNYQSTLRNIPVQQRSHRDRLLLHSQIKGAPKYWFDSHVP